MALYKNVASQKIAVYAYDTAADAPKTGDAANITAQISKDGGATAATNDTNPTELDATDAPGIYLFDLTQAESNCDLFILFAKSSTADIQLEPVIAYTLPGTNAGVLADTVKWAGVAPNPLMGGRVDAILGAFLIDESRVDGSCTEGGETKSFTTNLTETETDYYAGWVFMFTDAGTNRAVPRIVRSYNGGTKEITLVTDLPATTTNGHAFALVALTTGAELTDGSMALNMSYTSSAVLDAEQAGFLTAGTIGESINEAATNSADIQSRLPAALTGAGNIKADTVAISSSSTAADRAESVFLSLVFGAAQTGTLSTTQMSTNLTEATDDHYNGRLLTWVTGNLAGQQTDITDYDGATKVLTFTATTEAPGDGDTFVIT